MQINRNSIKVVGALVITIGVIFWAVNSIRPRSYDGANLEFAVGSGAVSISNPSEEAVPVQLVGTGSRTFRVTSTIEDVSGSSAREGNSGARTQLFEFELPPGTNELTITRGTDVMLIANAATDLEATVNPLSSDSSRFRVIVTIVVVLGALYYASNATEHQWISMLRQQRVSGHFPTQEAEPVAAAAAADTGQGQTLRPFGDNRGNTRS